MNDGMSGALHLGELVTQQKLLQITILTRLPTDFEAQQFEASPQVHLKGPFTQVS